MMHPCSKTPGYAYGKRVSNICTLTQSYSQAENVLRSVVDCLACEYMSRGLHCVKNEQQQQQQQGCYQQCARQASRCLTSSSESISLINRIVARRLSALHQYSLSLASRCDHSIERCYFPNPQAAYFTNLFLTKLCVKISILMHRRTWVRSFSTRLTPVTFAEDKVLIFLILHKKC